MKKILALLCTIAMIFVSGCGNTDAKLPEEIPTLSEMEAYRESHKEDEVKAYNAKVVELISALGDDGIYERIEAAFDKWAGEQKLLPLDKTEISFVNNLKMNEGYNQKYFDQVHVTAKLFFDESKVEGDEAQLLDEVFADMNEALRADTVGKYKIADTEIFFYGKEDSHERNHRAGEAPENIRDFSEFYDETDWQPEGEKTAQTIAYDYACEINDEYFADFTREVGKVTVKSFNLTHFGIYEDSVLVRFYTSDLMNEGGDEKHDEFRASLEEICSELADRIGSDKDASEYSDSAGGISIVIDADGLENRYTYVR